MRRDDLQFDLRGLPDQPLPDWLKQLLVWIGKALLAMGPAFKWVFWIGVALAGAVVLYFIGRELYGLIRRRWGGTPHGKAAAKVAEDWRPTHARALTLLEDADRLAAEGRFEEAAHLILFRSIEDIDRAWPNLIRPALTSRDIAETQVLSEAARTTFYSIARMVERSFFGGAALKADDFAACRQAYEAFALPTRR